MVIQDDEDVAYGTRRQKRLDAEWMRGPSPTSAPVSAEKAFQEWWSKFSHVGSDDDAAEANCHHAWDAAIAFLKSSPADLGNMTWRGYAFINEQGHVLADTQFESPEEAWRIGLGWPDKQEIQEAKRRGARVTSVMITELKGGRQRWVR